MILKSNIQMALSSIGASKWRSFLTMLGVIIGVSSVVTIVSLGEGVRQQLTNQINQKGNDLVTIRGGHVAQRNDKGELTDINIYNLYSNKNLSDNDYKTILTSSEISVVAPFANIAGIATIDGKNVGGNPAIIATNSNAPIVFNHEILYGRFFDENNSKKSVAVIGRSVAENVFGENVPLGKSFELRGKKVIVIGIFDKFESSPLTPGTDHNNSIFIPYQFASEMIGEPLQPYEILFKPSEGIGPEKAASSITNLLKKSHGGQVDFTVLLASDSLVIVNSMLNILTGLVTAVAAISLIVGGIGIMNIMLVAVSERTHEIGIRKSVGATNIQIMNQFLTESIMLSLTGGILGVLLSLFANYFLRIFTNLQPVITFPIMIIAVGVALIVGVVFGVTPALKAARKDPIEALRRI